MSLPLSQKYYFFLQAINADLCQVEAGLRQTLVMLDEHSKARHWKTAWHSVRCAHFQLTAWQEPVERSVEAPNSLVGLCAHNGCKVIGIVYMPSRMPCSYWDVLGIHIRLR